MLKKQHVMKSLGARKAPNTSIWGNPMRFFTPFTVTYRFINIQEAVMKRAAILAIGLVLFGASSAYSAPTCPSIIPIGGFEVSQEGANIARVSVGEDRKVYVADINGGSLNVYFSNGAYAEAIAVDGILSVAVSGGKVYVGRADKVRNNYHGEVRVLDADLNYLYSLGQGVGEFVHPAGIAAGNSMVYVADKIGSSVKAYSDADGAYLFSFASGVIVKPVGIAVHPVTGKVYVTDHVIDSTASSSTTEMQWGRMVIKVRMPSGPGYGTGLAVFNGADGSFESRFPISYGFDKDALILITDASGNPVLDEDGDQPSIVPMKIASGVSIDSQDRVYVTDAGFDLTRVFKSNGGYICDVANNGEADYPQSPAITTDGRFIVSTTNGIRSYSTDDFVEMGVTPNALAFAEQECTAVASGQVITVSNGGSGALDWTAVSDSTWLSVDTASGTISGVGAQSINVSIDSTGLGSGAHTGNITVSSGGGTSVVQVAFTKYAPPVFTVTQGGAPYNFFLNGNNLPSSKQLTVSLSGVQAGSLGWSFSPSDAWISTAPSSGSSGADTLAAIGIDSSALAVMASGNYAGSVVVSASCASIADVTFPVTLEYYEGGTIEVTSNNPSATYTITGPVTYSGSGSTGVFYDAPAGLYTINFGGILGYASPVAYSIEMAGKEIISFTGDYADIREDNDIIVTRGGSSSASDSMANVFDGDGTGLASFIIGVTPAPNAGGSPAPTPGGGRPSNPGGRPSNPGPPAGGPAAPETFIAASGDLDGDGVDEIVVVAPDGAIEGYTGIGEAITGLSFIAFNSGTSQDLAMGDLDGDGIDEIIVGSGTSSGDDAEVRAFSYTSGAYADTGLYFVAYPELEGVYVATGDVDGDGADEILTTRAVTDGTDVLIRIWDVETSVPGAWSVVAAGEIVAGISFEGSDVATGDIDSDGSDEILVTVLSARGNPTSAIVIYEMDGTNTLSFQGPGTGLRLDAGDLDMDGSAEIVVSEGASRTSATTVTVYGSDGSYRGEFNAFTDTSIYGALVTVGQTKAAR